MKKKYLCFLSFFLFIVCSVLNADTTLNTSIKEILDSPKAYIGKTVNISGIFTGWKNAPSAPPISRSDWVICNEDNKGIYCAGKMPQDPETSEPPKYGDKISLLAEVCFSDETELPYLIVLDIMPIKKPVVEMVSIMNILLNAPESVGETVSVMGVLAKGYGVKGDRQYLIADPTGVIKLGRLPKLYPTGTILHINALIAEDENGLPYLDNIVILSAKVD